MSKVFAFSTRAPNGVSVLRYSAYIREWMPRERGSAKRPSHKRSRGKAGWRKKDVKQIWVPSPLKVVTSINEASLLATANSGARHALHVA
jgi:hypothetical protein